MGYDNCCALCSASVSQVVYEDTDVDENDEDEYDTSLIKVRDVLWLTDVRVISENREALSINKVFISGLAIYDDIGFFTVELGNHPNFPTREQIDYDWDGQVTFRCYDWGTDHAFAVPFHAACYRLLEEFVSIQLNAGTLVDDEILYQTFKDFVDEQDGFSVCLTKIDYGTELKQRFWLPGRGEEYMFMNPVEIPLLQEYYDNLPLLEDANTDTKNYRDISEAQLTNDPLSKLPPELLFAILISLPMASVNALRAASPAVAQLELNNGFWKQKLRQDMPWLFDLPSNPYEEVNWAQCYADLRARSQNQNPSQIRGLVNRRRVWGICEQLASSYSPRKAAKDEERRRSQGSLLTHATSTPMRRLTLPQAKSDSSALALLKSLSDLDDLPILSVFWSSEGALSGFGVQREGLDTIGSSGQFAVRDEVKVEKNDWIRGFVITSRSSTEAGEDGAGRKVVGLKVLFIHGEPIQLGQGNGDHLLMHAEGDRILAGVLAQWSPGGPISGLSLLHVPVSKDSPYAAELARAQARKPESSTRIGSQLWKNYLPPPEMVLSEAKFGYWSLDYKADLAPIEALVFGEDEAELADITELSGDIQLGGFQVRYANKPPKSIGPRPLTMKSISIDGPGGERIVAVGIVVEHITKDIRFLTNYNRQLILGTYQPNARSETIYASTEEKSLRGIYCNWTSPASPKARLECIACLFSTSASTTPSIGPQDTTENGNERWWEPCSPPASWTVSGPVYGAHEVVSNLDRKTRHPTCSAVVTWLDCTTQPVRKVRINFAHRTHNLPFTPISLILEYTDGSTSSVGPTHLIPAEDTEGENGEPWCWCHLDWRLSEYESQLGKVPHYLTGEEWNIEPGAMLDSCRIWVDNDGPLRGLQFVSTSAGESPHWGVCEGQPTAVIKFSSGGANGSGNGAVGLKMFLDRNERPVTYDDTVIIGIQALAEF